jgi:hypothetical protein
MRTIIIEPAIQAGYWQAMPEDYDLCDAIGIGQSPTEALDHYLFAIGFDDLNPDYRSLAIQLR